MKKYLFCISRLEASGSGFGLLESHKSYEAESILDAWSKALEDISIPNALEILRWQSITVRYVGELDE